MKVKQITENYEDNNVIVTVKTGRSTYVYIYKTNDKDTQLAEFYKVKKAHVSFGSSLKSGTLKGILDGLDYASSRLRSRGYEVNDSL